MRRLPTLLTVLAAASALAGCYASERVRDPATDGDADSDVDIDADADGDAPFAVHEWGVFSGPEVHAGPGRWGEIMADKPVLYFYADEPMTIDVGVGFPGGFARETWPEVDLGEAIGWDEVRIDPTPCAAYSPFPEWGEGQCEEPWSHICEATELGSYTVDDASCLTVGSVTSPLLFYAGRVGNAPLPLEGTYCYSEATSFAGSTHVELVNQLDEPLGPTFLIYRRLEGECYPWEGCWITRARVGTLWLDEVPTDRAVDALIHNELLQADEGDIVTPPEWLMAEEASLAGMLTDAGLTEAEAEALLAGWRHTFLDLQPDDNMVSVPMGESLAVVTLLPRSYFDDALPIEIEPAPRELVRVGLGYQYLTSDCLDEPSDSSSSGSGGGDS